MEIWPDNWQAVLVFNGLATQWRRESDHIAGLIYQSVGPVAEGYGTTLAAVFRQVQIMEEAALSVYRTKGL